MDQLIVFTYEDRSVAFDPAAKRWNLTEMHRAAGSVPHKAPAQWLRHEPARELIAALEKRLNCVPEHSLVGEIPPSLIEVNEGRTGSTWAHWQIAAAYAHYLRPDFYLQWNEWAMAHATGQPTAPTASALNDLAARVAALEAAQRAPAAPLLLARALDDLATAIVAVLGADDIAYRPAEVVRRLERAGWGNLSNARIKVRMARLARRGAICKVGHGLYRARTKE